MVRGQGLQGQRRASSGGHVRFERVRRLCRGSRLARYDGERSLFDQSPAKVGLQASPGRRSHRLFFDRRHGLFQADAPRSLCAIHQPLGLEQGGSIGQAVPAKEADYFLDREHGTVQVSQADSRRHPRVEQGVRKSGLCRCGRGSPATGQGRLGSGRHQLQHRSLDNGGRGNCLRSLACQSIDRPDPGRGHSD